MRGPSCNKQSIFEVLGVTCNAADDSWFVGKTETDIMHIVNGYVANGGKQSTLDAIIGGLEYGDKFADPSVTCSGTGCLNRVSHLYGFWELEDDEFINSKNRGADPVGLKWEELVLCDVMGVKVRDRDDCTERKGTGLGGRPDGISFAFLFKRSLSDEFGAAVVGDL